MCAVRCRVHRLHSLRSLQETKGKGQSYHGKGCGRAGNACARSISTLRRDVYAPLACSDAPIRLDNRLPLVGLGSTPQSAVYTLSGSNNGKCPTGRTWRFMFLLSLGFHHSRHFAFLLAQRLFSTWFCFLWTLARASFPKRRHRHLKAE